MIRFDVSSLTALSARDEMMVLQIVGAVLGVLQVAVAVEMVLRALHELGVLSG